VNGLTGQNGLGTVNGLSTQNGLASTSGLSALTGLMTTAGGRNTVAYLVRCALAAGDTLVKQDQSGVSYTFNGGIGLCPQWKTGSIHSASNRTCQNLVSACLMAHVNTAGVHIPIWMASEATQIGWGLDTVNYPAQEGTFFGNILETGDLSQMGMAGLSGPKAYYCEGTGFSLGTVQGRLGAGQQGANLPYTNPYNNGACATNGGSNVTPFYQAGPTGPINGFKSASVNGYIFQNGEPITIWRNPGATTVTFNSAYTYRLTPKHASGKSMDVAGASQNNGTAVQQYSSWDGDPQKWAILPSGSNWKIAMKANTNKCLSPVNNGTGNGTQMEIRDCNGSSNQAWAATVSGTGPSNFAFNNVAANRCLDVTGASTADGARMQLWDCNGQSNQLFSVASY